MSIKCKCEHLRPDQIAEGLPVSLELTARLWNEILPVYSQRADYPHPYPGEYEVQSKHYWDLLTDAEKREINNAYEKEFPGGAA